MRSNTIKNALDQLERYIENNNYRGYDPYDALKSPLFKLPFFRKNKFVRFGSQQLVKRFPFNIRPLLFVPKGYNPVTLGLCIQGYSYLTQSAPENKATYIKKIEYLVDELKKLIPSGFSGACWGYDFDWEARNAKIPAYQPTVVATGIIANALFIAYQITGNKEIPELIKSASSFVLNDLNRTFLDKDFCFSYSPFDKQQVFNASMKGVRILSQAFAISGNEDLIKTAKKGVEFVINHQKVDDSWGYSLTRLGGWTDNYHTGYILDCLDEYQRLSGDNSYSLQIRNGYHYYLNNFVTEHGAPKFYNNSTYPIDCTAAAQFILTTARFGDMDLAKNVSVWMVDHMQNANGSFKFRKFKNYTVHTSFMRWSNAWMFVSLCYLKFK